MAAFKATVLYAGLVTDSAAMETAIETGTYSATSQFVVVPQAGGLSCVIIQVETA